MQIIDGKLVVSASDLVGHMHCEHLTWLTKRAARGEIVRPASDHPMLELLKAQGTAHELAYLERLRDRGGDVVDILDAGAAGHAGPSNVKSPGLPEGRAAATLAAMRAGKEVIYQATLLDRNAEPITLGYADFLRRVDTPSELGEWSYEPEDTKLSTYVSAWAVLQLCVYAEEIARIQGHEPEFIHVVLGSEEIATIRLADVSAYFRGARTRFDQAVGSDPAIDGDEPYPLPVEHCARCSWWSRCAERWRIDDHLSQVAFIRMDQVRKIEAAGITTMAALAEQPAGLTVPGIGDATVVRLREQAELQVASAQTEGPPAWRAVTPIEDGLGLAMLPAPSPGDVFYDIEGHPYAERGGLEYLHGFATIDTGAFAFTPWWAHDPFAEHAVTEQLIDMFIARQQQWPDMHIYHYAHYEVTALKRLVMRYGTREAELDHLLRTGAFVDLYKVVRQGVRVGVASYSIKRLEPLYMDRRDGEIGNGGSSILEYEKWRTTGDQKILDEIVAYNRDDVKSTKLLRKWLEERRADLEQAGTPVPRPKAPDATLGDTEDPEVQALIGQLLDGIEPTTIERIRGASWSH